MERIEPVEFEAILRNFNTLANISARLEGVPGNLDRLLACLNRGMEVLKNPILQELEAGDHRDVIEVIDLLDRAAKQINGGMWYRFIFYIHVMFNKWDLERRKNTKEGKATLDKNERMKRIDNG